MTTAFPVVVSRGGTVLADRLASPRCAGRARVGAGPCVHPSGSRMSRLFTWAQGATPCRAIGLFSGQPGRGRDYPMDVRGTVCTAMTARLQPLGEGCARPRAAPVPDGEGRRLMARGIFVVESRARGLRFAGRGLHGETRPLTGKPRVVTKLHTGHGPAGLRPRGPLSPLSKARGYGPATRSAKPPSRGLRPGRFSHSPDIAGNPTTGQCEKRRSASIQLEGETTRGVAVRTGSPSNSTAAVSILTS